MSRPPRVLLGGRGVVPDERQGESFRDTRRKASASRVISQDGAASPDQKPTPCCYNHGPQTRHHGAEPRSGRVKTNDHGAIVDNTYAHGPEYHAIGDVTGRTCRIHLHVSLDDYQVLRDELFGDGRAPRPNTARIPLFGLHRTAARTSAAARRGGHKDEPQYRSGKSPSPHSPGPHPWARPKGSSKR